MLSIGKSPSDPPCPCEISWLKSSDERAASASSDKVAFQEEVDLLRSDLDDNKNNPLPKFSIRDYVFSSRSQDIKTNWPFSERNLQLCLRHGVTDLLPPFQSLDSMRKQSTDSFDKAKTSNFYGALARPSDRPGQELDLCCVNSSLSRSEGDKEPQLSTSLSIPNPNTNSISETKLPLEASAGKFEASGLVALRTGGSVESPEGKIETAGSPVSNKPESTNQPPVKKCRLIVKVGNRVDPSSKEDSTSNCMTLPEAMVSKVCPVCKTFSSSSNTTLNAHIDQCLSVESSNTKWSMNSGAIKHRIKPRKTRLMVDIYVTAPHCTLEDLDRRNGRNWAMSSNLPAQEAVERAEEKHSVPMANPKDNSNEGAVYIDANGTKLRILSKSDDILSGPKLEDGGRCQKPSRGCKTFKCLSAKKKRHHMQKLQKYLKLAPQSQKIRSRKSPHNFEICGGREMSIAVGGSCDAVEGSMKQFRAQQQKKAGDLATIRKWACAKRTSFSNRTIRKNGLQHLPVEGDQPSLGDSHGERSFKRMLNSSESPFSSPESSRRMEKSSSVEPVIDCAEQPPPRKRIGFSSLGLLTSDNMDHKAKQLLNNTIKDTHEIRRNRVSSPDNKLGEINAGSIKTSDSHHDDRPNTSQDHHHDVSAKPKKLSSLRKHKLVAEPSFVPESKCNLSRDLLAHKKSGSRSQSELDGHALPSFSKLIGADAPKEKHAAKESREEENSDEVSLGRSSVLKKRAASQKVQDSSLEMPSNCQIREKVESYLQTGSSLSDTFGTTESRREGIQTNRRNVDAEPSTGLAVGDNIASLSNSLDPEFDKLVSPSNSLSDSLRCVVLKESLSGVETPMGLSEPSMTDDHDFYNINEVRNTVLGKNSDLVADIDSKAGPGSYFPGVDPIPIPGPPGSFLPSPRDMGSDDLHGNSSLTSSRVQSYEDQHDLINRASSDSPTSVTSTISNSTVARSDSQSSEKIFVCLSAVQDEMRSGFSSASHDPVVENIPKGPQAKSIHSKRINLHELKGNGILSGKRPANSGSDQPCCCFRKEGISQSVASNYQDSQILRKHSMGSGPLHTGKQLSSDPNRRLDGLNSMSEIFSPGNLASSGTENVILPLKKEIAAAGPESLDVRPDPAPKFHIHDDYSSASPTSFRLMGKNLMVINKDENTLQHHPPLWSDSPTNNPLQHLRAVSGFALNSAQNEGLHTFEHMVHNRTHVFHQGQYSTSPHVFDVRLSNVFGNHGNPSSPHVLSHASANIISTNSFMDSFTVERHNHKGPYNLVREQFRPKNIQDTPSVCHMEKIVKNSGRPQRKGDSAANPMKEIIIIDDTPETKADSGSEALYAEAMRQSWVRPASIAVPMAANCNSRDKSPFYRYQLQDSFPYGGPPVMPNASFQVPSNKRANANHIRLNCTSEGSTIPTPSPLLAPLPSASHLGSVLYYSRGFS